MSRSRPRPRPTVAAGVLALALALAAAVTGCGDADSAQLGATSTTAAGPGTTPASSTTIPGSTTAPPPSTPTDGSEAAPRPADPAWRRYEERWVVTGVAADDTLNVRRGPGTASPVVHELAPDADDVVLYDVVEEVDGSRWGPVAVAEGAGWVNLQFLRPPGTNPPTVRGTPDPRTESAADDVQAALGAGELQRLAGYAAERGVLFSTDAFVADDDPVLSAAELAGAVEDRRVIRWGVTDGEGAPIEMTIAERLAEIGRDRGIASTDVIGFATRVRTGNTIDNVAERFPGAAVVEYHFDGTSLYGDFDWSSVRFVFDTSGEGRPELLAVVQDTWTI